MIATRSSRLAVALALAGLLPSQGTSCHRRLRDLVPAASERSDLEMTLLVIIENLEDCVEAFGGDDGTRREVLGRILSKWSELYEAARASEPPPSVGIPAEEYRLVLDSVQDYAMRVREAWDSGNRQEAVRQEIALQHVVAELYGANPGQISNARSVHYTATTYAHLPPLTLETREAWETRTRLLRIRLDRWLEEVGENAEKLGVLRLLRTGVAGLLTQLAPRATEDEASPLDSELAAAVAKDLESLAKRAPGAVLRASWSRKGVPKDLQEVPKREMYPNLERPPGS